MANQKQSKSKSIIGINWFTVVLFVVLAFVFIQKDLSLNFNLNAPLKMEEGSSRKFETPSQKKPTQQKSQKKREGKLTEKASHKSPPPTTEKGTSFFNFFDNPFGKSKKVKDLKVDLDKIDEATKQGYLKRFAHVAISEQEKFGIPASVILANALLHSSAGKGDVATTYNNHFTISCGNDWDGGTGSLKGICYRTYETAWMSFRNHSQYITSEKFSNLTRLNAKDYKGWANGLEKAKFSNTKNLAKNIIRIIEQYGLNDLD